MIMQRQDGREQKGGASLAIVGLDGGLAASDVILTLCGGELGHLIFFRFLVLVVAR
jgi:hypothetical protein